MTLGNKDICEAVWRSTVKIPLSAKFFAGVYILEGAVWRAAGSAQVLSVNEVKADEPPHDRLNKFLDGCQVNTPNGAAVWLAHIHLREKGYWAVSNAVDPVAIECATYALYPGTSIEVADAYTYWDFFEYDPCEAPSNLDKFLIEVSQCA
jgi:hypothetical protein